MNASDTASVKARRASWRTLAPFVAVAAGALLLCAAVAMNGYPFFFNDSADYILVGRDIVGTLLQRFGEAAPAPAAAAAATGPAGAPAAPSDPMALTYMASRSAYYSLLTGGLMALADVWGPVTLQALASAWIVWLLVRTIAPGLRLWGYVAIMAALTLATSLPFFVGFIMPDVYAGLGIAAILLLAFYWQALAWPERMGLFVLLAAAGAFHTSNVAVFLSTGLASGVLAAMVRPRPAKALLGVATGLGAIVASVAAVAAYGVAVQAFYGAKIDNPPFLMARILEDGPGRDYLAISCPTKRWTICDYRHLPLSDANQILWDPNPATGVFFPASYATRRKLNAEQMAFVMGSVAHDPAAQVLSSARNGLETLVRVRVSPEFGGARAVWRDSLVKQVIPAAPFLASGAFRGALPLQVLDIVQVCALVAALLFLAWRLTRPDVLGAPDGPARLYACTVLALIFAVLANAALCGAASGPFDRYQARLIWLIPAIALIGLARFGLRAAPRQERV